MKWIFISLIFLLNFSLSAGIKALPKVEAKNAMLTGALDLNKSGLKSRKGNDIWGWTDPETGKEIAIMGLDSKTSFVDVSNPANPVHLADIKTQSMSSTWRDMKVYKNYVFIVSEAWRHGMQVFDLSKLRGLDGSQVKTFKADVHYNKFGNAHNIAINEDTGFAYAVGTRTCDGGLHIIDIREPLSPKFVNCVGRGVYELPKRENDFNLNDKSRDGNAYTHDVQCVVYKGPDSRFLGKEICVASNENTVNVVDVTDKSNPYQISVSTYDQVKYTHQGWLSEDHRFFFLGDELDEQRLGVNTKTFIWDFTDLTNIKHTGTFLSSQKAVDHNMYTKDGLIFQANYTAGLRVLDYSQAGDGILEEIAYVDTMPEDNKASFKGIWSVYPYFESGTIILSGINGTLYVTQLNL